jgi:hypothetical protein
VLGLVVVSGVESGGFSVCAVVPVFFRLGSRGTFAIVGGWFVALLG